MESSRRAGSSCADHLLQHGHWAYSGSSSERHLDAGWSWKAPRREHDGCELLVKDDVQTSITVANRPTGYAWLRDNGHGAIIKVDLVVDARALSDTDRQGLRDLIEESEFGVAVEDKESVHAATLKSLVKELLEKGTTLPPAISVHQFKKAELKEPKVKK